MRRRALTVALLGLLGGLALRHDAHAFGGHRGQTYHYNGSYGTWTGGSYANCCPAYAVQPAYSPHYAAQPAYYAPRSAYAAPQPAVYAQPQPAWRPATPQR